MTRTPVPPPTATRVFTVLVWVGVLATGAIGGVATTVALAPEPAHTTPRPTDAEADAPAAAGWATSYLTAWLRAGDGDEESLRQFTGADTDLGGVRPGRVRTNAVWSLDTTRVGRGNWSVLLAASLERLEEDEPKDGGVHYFRVAVHVTGSADERACTALGTPVEVSAPFAPTPPPLAYPEPDVATEGPLGDTVSEFLTAYLTGRGDVTRYASPGTRFVAVTPPTAATVRLTRLDRTALPDDDSGKEERVPADGARVHVLAAVTVTDTAELRLLPSYPLLLTARAGRWEVSAIERVPLLGTPPPSRAPTPVTPTTAVPTTTAPPGE